MNTRKAANGSPRGDYVVSICEVSSMRITNPQPAQNTQPQSSTEIVSAALYPSGVGVKPVLAPHQDSHRNRIQDSLWLARTTAMAAGPAGRTGNRARLGWWCCAEAIQGTQEEES